MNQVLKKFKKQYSERKTEEMPLADYLERARTDSTLYANVYERLLKSIGAPTLVDTSKDERLGRIHGNRLIKLYDSFSDFYGMEKVIEQIVGFLTHASQGLEEANQILYFLGPVGSAKSSLGARLKQLLEQEPIYMIKDSPIQESPLGLFTKADAEELGIPERYFGLRPSALALQQLDDFGGDLSKFVVQKVHPSEAYQRGIGVVAAADPNTQDVSDLVGKLNIRALEQYPSSDARAYSFSGGLCHGNQGVMEFIEMFKADINILNPLLTATQEHFYKATEAIPAIPFQGIIMAHSNETEWDAFRGNKANEALLDRICIVKVPYCLRYSDEINIYTKFLRRSDLANAACAPGTLEMLAKFVILSRLENPENSDIYTKLHVYNGEHRKDKDPHTKSLYDYQRAAGTKEGFEGVSSREAFKILAKVFNFGHEEIAANPVHLMRVIEAKIEDLFIGEEEKAFATSLLQDSLAPEYFELVSKDIQTAYLDSYDQYGQSLFDRYITYADQWVQDRDYRDPQTGQLLDRRLLDIELETIEKPAAIANPKDFRQQVVTFCVRYQSKNGGNNPHWTEYNKIRDVIERNMFSKTEDLIPLISFNKKGTEDEQHKHAAFVERMQEKGYTEKQVRLLVEWQQRYHQSKV